MIIWLIGLGALVFCGIPALVIYAFCVSASRSIQLEEEEKSFLQPQPFLDYPVNKISLI
jgi:hypothetical protein